jgi:signal peptidase I
MADMIEADFSPEPEVEVDLTASIQENNRLMKSSFRKMMTFFLSMTIAVLIVILRQGEKLFLFNFSSNNLNDETTFFVFRLATIAFLAFTLVYLIYFSIVCLCRKSLPESKQLSSLPEFRKRYDLFDLLGVVPLFIAVFVFVTGFILSPAVVEGSSMEPSFTDGEPVIIYHFLETYSVDDVVIVDIGTELLIKRLIGMPGDTLRVDATGVYVNGIQVQIAMPAHFIPYDGVIPANSYFIMGDNRNNSMDGRQIGLVYYTQLLGFVLFPDR